MHVSEEIQGFLRVITLTPEWRIKDSLMDNQLKQVVGTRESKKDEENKTIFC